MKDILIENEKGIATISFQTEKAKNVLMEKTTVAIPNTYVEKNVLKVDVAVENQGDVEAWCKENDLTF